MFVNEPSLSSLSIVCTARVFHKDTAPQKLGKNVFNVTYFEEFLAQWNEFFARNRIFFISQLLVAAPSLRLWGHNDADLLVSVYSQQRSQVSVVMYV